MDKEEIRKKMFETKYQLTLLGLSERNNKEHPLYQELLELKRLYALTLYKEKEIETNGKHKK